MTATFRRSAYAFSALSLLTLTALAADPWAQSAPPGASGAALFKDLQWRNIGPANMAGRVTDIEAVEVQPRHRLRRAPRPAACGNR